ncbi:MAG: hypothetical protein QG577_156 [Thermodesulfobacteriota bacterium]|nr:hypothetical protein [Thermodesulfobacteriota bacterium]
MIQVRCPECSYLQTLSEERFSNISEDFLNCPHCHARIPKQWTPVNPDNVPDDVRHRIVAFSRRILNGGEVSKAVVSALEALVRRHGQIESSLKALGIGYAYLGESKKAEEYLLLALDEPVDSEDILRWLLKVQLDLKNYDEAYKTGTRLTSLEGVIVRDEDVARTALALMGLERDEEARYLLESYPNLDKTNATVKKVLRKMNRGKTINQSSWYSALRLFNNLMATSGKHRFQTLRDKAVSLIKSNIVAGHSEKREFEGRGSRSRQRFPIVNDLKSVVHPRTVHMEYWIYCPTEQVPDWQKINNDLETSCSNDLELKSCFAQMDHLIHQGALTIEYVTRSEAEDLFEYPEDMLPRNSRGLSDADVDTVKDARMIVRLRFLQRVDNTALWLHFVALVAEVFRSMTHGVVQDVVSHTLWGEREWKKNLIGTTGVRLDSHVNCEAVEESDGLWIHTHGMQKFGLPELELEQVPGELAVQAPKLMLMIARTLLQMNPIQGSVVGPLSVASTPFSFSLSMRNPDDEGHFPGGSCMVKAFMRGHDPNKSDATHEVLTRIAAHNESVQSSSGDTSVETEEDLKIILRDKLLHAHKRARTDLPLFKRSFRREGTSDGRVHAVKVRFDSEQGEHEWMWVSLDTWKGRELEGYLANSPVLIKSLAKGSRINVSDKDIFDWVIMSNGSVLEGGFTETQRTGVISQTN